MNTVNTENLTEMLALANDNKVISLLLGSPGKDTLSGCNDIFLKSSTSILNKDADPYTLFGYGITGGDKTFLQQLSDFLSGQYGGVVDSQNLMITAGATHGLHLILSLLCQKSCPVFIEDPCYFLGFKLIRDDLQMDIIPVTSDNEGMNPDTLDRLLTEYKSRANPSPPANRYWAAVYLVPVFGNPTSRTFSEDYCKKLVQVARKHDILLITDDVYNFLHFTNASHPPPRLITYDKKTDPDYGRGHVISAGTFSKILAPSLRLGWMEGPTDVISYLNKSFLANSGGSFNHYISLLVTSIIKSGVLVDHIKFLRQTYKRRVDVMCSILDTFPEGCSYEKPEGGFFVWLTLRPDVDALQLLGLAIRSYGVSFLPGMCTSPTESFKNCIRLSISSNSEDLIREGTTRLYLAYQEYTKSLDKV